MKLLIEKIADLRALYVKELRLLLSAEEMIAIKSPLMADSAGDTELIHLFSILRSSRSAFTQRHS